MAIETQYNLDPVPQHKDIEYGFQLPNGHQIWKYWNPVLTAASSLIDEDGQVKALPWEEVREAYRKYVQELGINLSDEEMAEFRIVARARYMFYTHTEVVK
jgi:hypothetical protein